MLLKDARYAFKQGLNKIDSNQYRNLKIPEIDWILYEAYLMIVKAISHPRHLKRLERYGFELNQRNIDDLKNLIVTNEPLDVSLNGDHYEVILPERYMFHMSSKIKAHKDSCEDLIRTILIKHDNLSNQKVFYRPSWDWRRVNIRFSDGKIYVYTDDEFIVSKFYLSYIKIPLRVHSTTYKLPSGVELVGSQEFEVSDHLVQEIVDLAVIIASVDLDNPNTQNKFLKNKLN